MADLARGVVVAGSLAWLAAALFSIPDSADLAAANSDQVLASVENPLEISESTPPAPDRVEVLERGETLGELLRDLGLDHQEVAQVADAASSFIDPRQLRPGLQVAAFLDEGAPSRFEFAVRGKGELSLARSVRGDEAWSPSWRAYERETRTRVVRGELRDSLDGSLTAAGGRSELAYAMADVLQWDLDFTRDLHNGDEFEVLFEEIYLEGDYFGLGRILALSYSQPRRKFEVFRFGEGEAYYDAEGRPLEKMFLRAPLPYSRVTSKFSTRRFHPVLKVNRPHYGVDYGAPAGTPVRVTATGTVRFAGWDRGGGKTVKVGHANDFETCYLHLSRFASGVRSGARVRQGEVIGYVGSTGLATAAHLDYRVRQNGRWIDPLSLKSVPAAPLSVGARRQFFLERDAMTRALSTGEPFVLPLRQPRDLEPTRVAAVAEAATPRTQVSKKK